MSTQGEETHQGMNKFEIRYRVIRALIDNGPCTTREIENVFSVSDGTIIDLLPVLREMEEESIEYDQRSGKWIIPWLQ